MENVCQSGSLCRLCGRDRSCTLSLYDENKSLLQRMAFILPIEFNREGPFPRRVCQGCITEFSVVFNFFVKLNDGQAKLARLLRSNENISISMPDWISERPTLFKEKYPCCGSRKPPPKPPRTRNKRNFQAANISSIKSTSHGPEKRLRKLPKRLEESVLGTDFENVFKNEVANGKNHFQETESPTQLPNAVLDIGVDCLMASGQHASQHPPKGCLSSSSTLSTSVMENTNSINSSPRKIDTNPIDLDRVMSTDGFEKNHFPSPEDDSKYILRSKKRRKKKAGLFACEFGCCQEEFDIQNDLIKHQKAVHSDEACEGRDVTCNECGRIFKSESNLRVHLYKVHSIDNKDGFECTACGKVFLHTSSLYYHVDSEHSSSVYSCTICSKVFKNKQLMARHAAIVHTDSRPFACDLCDTRFKSSTNLKTHQTTHSKEKKFSCDRCGKQFSYKTSLIQHIKWHGGEKPYHCPYCSKTFSQNGNLQEHIRIHTGVKPYVCNLCGRKFTTSSQYRLHEKRHRGEKPWQCEHCPKSFLNKDSHAAHMRRHKGDRPYECDFCKKTFTDAWAMRKHKRMHTGEKPYNCVTCGKTYSDCSNLLKHRRTHEPHASQTEETLQTLSTSLNLSDAPNQSTDCDEVEAQAQVWSIFNEATVSATAVGEPTNDVLSNIALQVVSHDGAMQGDQSIQQVIYVAYEANEGVDAVISNAVPSQESTTVRNDRDTEARVNSDAIDLCSFSNMQLAETVSQRTLIASQNGGEVTVGGRGDDVELSNAVDIQIIQPLHDDATAAEGLDQSIQINILSPSVNQSNKQVTTYICDEGGQNLEALMISHSGEQHSFKRRNVGDESEGYVGAKDNDHSIPVAMPANFDPVAYAGGYLQQRQQDNS